MTPICRYFSFELFFFFFFFLLLPNHRKIFFLLLELCRNEYPSRKTSANEKWAAMIKNSSKDIRFLSFYFFVVPFSKPSTVINERLNNSSARFYIFSCDLVVVGYWLWLCWCCCLLFSLTCVSHAIVGTSAAQDFYRNLGVRHQRHTTAQSVHRGDTTERKK